MTNFLRLLAEDDKGSALEESCARVRQGVDDARCFDVAPDAFDAVPGKPFAYWVSQTIRDTFTTTPKFEYSGRTARQGLATADDFRFVRIWWEVSRTGGWMGFAKGGAFSPAYADVYLVANWKDNGKVMKAWADPLYGNSGWSRILKSTDFYSRPGLTWPRRTQGGLSLRAMPAGCIFADKGPAAFVKNDEPEELLALLALVNSRAFGLLVSLQMAFGSYEVGVIQRTPVPVLTPEQRIQLASLARRAWSLKRSLDTVTETSHAFLLPLVLRQTMDKRLVHFDPAAIKAELARIQADIDDIAFVLYVFSTDDRAAALGSSGGVVSDDTGADDEDSEGEEEAADDIPSADALLSWAMGVAFGRFDIRIATGERAAPHEPEPFDALPEESPGMLPDGDAPFHAHAGILADDPGHAHDLVRIAERVLERVDMPVPTDLQRWLQKDFFPFHLQRYSKSRRKAPIYWPLATASGSYTLWLYYPSLTSQTLYTAIIDFVEPKLVDVVKEAAPLKAKGSARTRDEEKRLETLASLEAELTELRDQLQAIAVQYQPNHDDGVQITAAPLWPLFRHKPWQKLLKETWVKLQKGGYDWAHLAMNYWPERVREKCKTDKSLAIAHDLEDLYVVPEATPKKTRSRKKTGGDE